MLLQFQSIYQYSSLMRIVLEILVVLDLLQTPVVSIIKETSYNRKLKIVTMEKLKKSMQGGLNFWITVLFSVLNVCFLEFSLLNYVNRNWSKLLCKLGKQNGEEQKDITQRSDWRKKEESLFTFNSMYISVEKIRNKFYVVL